MSEESEDNQPCPPLSVTLEKTTVSQVGIL